MIMPSYYNEQQRKPRKNALKLVIITAAIGAVAAIGAFLFDALWLFGLQDLKLQKDKQKSSAIGIIGSFNQEKEYTS